MKTLLGKLAVRDIIINTESGWSAFIRDEFEKIFVESRNRLAVDSVRSFHQNSSKLAEEEFDVSRRSSRGVA
jgi:hypothetical protein